MKFFKLVMPSVVMVLYLWLEAYLVGNGYPPWYSGPLEGTGMVIGLWAVVYTILQIVFIIDPPSPK